MVYNTILYPARQSEFEVQSLIFTILKSEKYNVRGEVKALRSRLDIVVYNDNNKAVCIIEVKARARVRKKPRQYKQVMKYEELFGLPVIICLNRSQVRDTINQVRRIINDSSCNN
ncbi:type I restriction enzyme HsdR N-terminal domain-containing protein [Candidatus Pacearchaeota archaeon]|nr:type I restriction enzyme HsdR N-terminal domain-containing protein [Candidatus Pacearchaeota archaeon]